MSNTALLGWILSAYRSGCDLDKLRLIADALMVAGEHSLATMLRIHSWNEDHTALPEQCGNLLYVGMALLEKGWLPPSAP